MCRFVTILSLALVLVISRPAMASQSSDDRIYDQVRVRLTNDPDVKGGAIAVDVQNGVVTLKGKVRQERERLKAEKLTKKVKGVKKVVNQLETEIQEPSRSAPQQ
ncbi:MAG: BON domain-containing protein [Acidobacteria bacterium]|nr:BON domain-containing protein [Acidobacteriota bacterium]